MTEVITLQLLFTVKNQTLKLITRSDVVADSTGYLTAKFECTDDWQGVTKIAQFKRDNHFFSIMLDEKGECKVPWEVLVGEGTFNVNIVGKDKNGKRITANDVDVLIARSGLTEEQFPDIPSEDFPQPMLDEIIKHEQKAQQHAQNAKASADSAMLSAQQAQSHSTNAQRSAQQAQDAANSIGDAVSRTSADADRAELAAGRAEQAKTDVKADVDKAKADADRATLQANTATEKAIAVEQMKNVAEQAKADARGSADSASASALKAKQAVNSIGTSVEQAGASADEAKKQADRAMQVVEGAELAKQSAEQAKTDAQASAENASLSAQQAQDAMHKAKDYSDNVNIFIPSVSQDGRLRWTNKAGIANPQEVNIKGPKGDTGEKGEPGPGLVIKDKYNSLEELKQQHPTATDGDAYLVGTELYGWSNGQWVDLGSLQGPKGDTGEKGDNAVIAEATATIDNTTGDPRVSVETIGNEQNRSFHFSFSGIKGERGPQGDPSNITVDSELSPTSQNPVQNKVVYSYINTKANTKWVNNNFLPFSGGVITGNITLKNSKLIFDPTADSYDIGYNWDTGAGAGCAFKSKTHGRPGSFSFFARKDTSSNCSLVGETNRKLTWCNDNIVRSVNGQKANDQGDVAVSIDADITAESVKTALGYTPASLEKDNNFGGANSFTAERFKAKELQNYDVMYEVAVKNNVIVVNVTDATNITITVPALFEQTELDEAKVYVVAVKGTAAPVIEWTNCKLCCSAPVKEAGKTLLVTFMTLGDDVYLVSAVNEV